MRRWKITGAALAALIVVLIALPYWIGAFLPAARLLHLTIGSYQREGYGRFRLLHAVYRRGNVRVTVAEAEADTPLLWGWRRLRGAERPVQARGWTVAIARAPQPKPPATDLGFDHLHEQLVRLADRLGWWLPRAALLDGSVRWPTGGFRLKQAAWDHRKLNLIGFSWLGGIANGQVVAEPGGAFRIDGEEPGQGARLALVWTGPTAEGTLSAWGRPIDLQARFGIEGWLPAEAEARAAEGNLVLPGLGSSSRFRELRGGGEADWRDGRFTVSLHARAEPRVRGVPPLRVALEAAGDRQAWSVRTFDLELPSGRVVLDRPIIFGYRIRPALTRARLTIALDLAGVPLLQARGNLSGTIELIGGAETLPVFDLDLAARDASWRGIPPGDYTLSGRCDPGRREVSGLKLAAVWAGAALARWLPAGGRIRSAMATARFDGPWLALRHSGTARVEGLALPGWRIEEGAIAWQGVQERIESFHAHAAAGLTTLELGGSATRAGLRLAELRFSPVGKEALSLAAPVTVNWGPELAIAPFSFAGRGSEIAGSYSAAGISIRLFRISSGWIRSLARWPGPDFEVNSAAFSGHWEQGRLAFTAQAAAEIDAPQGRVALSLSAHSQGAATVVNELQLASAGAVLAQANGTLPICWLQGQRRWRADPRAALSLRARVNPRSPVWRDLAAQAGLTIEGPDAVLAVDGTFEQPVGRLHLAIQELGPASGRLAWKVPTLQQLRLEAHADEGSIVIDRLSASILGHPITGSARLPVRTASWRARAPAIAWESAQASLSVAAAPASSLAALFPSVLSPQGRWGLNGELKNGAWNGILRLQGLGLRPIAPLGVVQDISGQVVCVGRSLSAKGLSAQVGGATVVLAGRAEAPAGGPLQFDFTLRGSSVPLVRQANLLVRSDLDLRVASKGPAGRITGRAVIGDGLLLGDLSNLLPNGMAGAARPPPYFSIGAAPFNDWRLDVGITANHTLRVQTPLFSGTGSAQFQLGGTLAEPRAVGQLRVDQGQVSLPFATFDVQFGAVRLGSDDPFHPRIDLQATARRYDYDLRMLASGPADAPVLTFTSNPALPSDQILALVMAGQLPQSGGLWGGGTSQVAGLGAYLGQTLLSGFNGQPSANRLTVSSGQELSVSGKPTYEIEYQLAPRWWLVGEYDVFDDYNADLKWRVYSRGPKR